MVPDIRRMEKGTPAVPLEPIMVDNPPMPVAPVSPVDGEAIPAVSSDLMEPAPNDAGIHVA